MIYHMCAIRVMVSKELNVVSEHLHPRVTVKPPPSSTQSRETKKSIVHFFYLIYVLVIMTPFPTSENLCTFFNTDWLEMMALKSFVLVLVICT